MRKRMKRLTLKMETIAQLSRLDGPRVAGADYTYDGCTTDWFSCLGFTCETWEYNTCVTSAC